MESLNFICYVRWLFSFIISKRSVYYNVYIRVPFSNVRWRICVCQKEYGNSHETSTHNIYSPHTFSKIFYRKQQLMPSIFYFKPSGMALFFSVRVAMFILSPLIALSKQRSQRENIWMWHNKIWANIQPFILEATDISILRLTTTTEAKKRQILFPKFSISKSNSGYSEYEFNLQNVYFLRWCIIISWNFTLNK